MGYDCRWGSIFIIYKACSDLSLKLRENTLSFRPFAFYLATLLFLASLLLHSNVNASLSIWGFDDPGAEDSLTDESEAAGLEPTESIGLSDANTLLSIEEVGIGEEESLSFMGLKIEEVINLPGAVTESEEGREETNRDLTPQEIEEEAILKTDSEQTDEGLSVLIDEIEETSEDIDVEDQAISVTYDIPIAPENKHVKKYIVLFQNRLRPNFEKWLARSGRYEEMIKTTLRENNLPEDLFYLALIESGFNPKAFSRAKATGVWQFMKGTGKRYGLRIDRWIDERRDPVKATQAAAKYLTELYNMFGSWPLALAGYNAGEGRVYRTIVRVRTRDFWTLRDSRHLRPETRNYVPKFMAATIIGKDPKRYNFFVEKEEAWVYDEVEIQDATYLSSIARYAGISVKELKNYNPELKRDITPPRAPGYKIKLPPGTKEAFFAAYSPEEEEKIFVGRSFKHRVRRGETISLIAQQYGVSVEHILKTNGLSSRSIIRVGQKILIEESPWRTGENTHVIRRGESISTIALKYKVSIRRLLEANNLHRRSVIRAGKTLIIPANSSHRVSRHGNKKHVIRTGESISLIARKYAVRIRDLLKANELTRSSVIHAGNFLIIP